jgi:hypothetical protein
LNEELMELCANVGWKAKLMADGQPIECRVGHAVAFGPNHTTDRKCILHVRGVGVDGWDGTQEGFGEYESEEALRQIFEAFGPFVRATVHHRVQAIADTATHGQSKLENTSYALVTMGSAAAVDSALAEDKVMAGTTALKVTVYSKEQASKSKTAGRMKRVEGE